ncbi:hypothetical protein DICPUDRAFT_96479 [Dictyostelium purpureum]|uniref:EGF-like domain-containing protein n=1 Tax=Dictyostelium purpureum TaxID=5786 RepID=F0Z8P0_DICPU|nr:uncharacterized protein DICPUDRAFT_96479 [Dictyostelium purpureum]EGC39667.1 hypothetical protein DICPUDRAFT_96479 [Dictyostelium purpureum]|eukprot:XP_003283776.1 hypothetical protein DICPUDRAFT_96479 [Dictyostelium purpureum]
MKRFVKIKKGKLLIFLKLSKAIEFQILDNYNFTRYPDKSNVIPCTFTFTVLISDPNGMQFNSVSQNFGGRTDIGYNSTHVFTQFSWTTDGLQTLIISAINSQSVSDSKEIILDCRAFDLDNLKIEFGDIYFDPDLGYTLLLKKTGIPSYTMLTAVVEGVPTPCNSLVDGIHDQLLIPYFAISNIVGQIKIDFNFINSIKTFYTTGYFNGSYDSNFQLGRVPENIDGTIQLMGKGLAPVFSYTCKTQTKESLFSSKQGSDFIYFFYKAIYESGGITTYLGSYLSPGSSLNYNLDLFTQKLNQKVSVYTQDVKLIDSPYTDFSTGTTQTVYMVDTYAIFLTADITSSPNEIYNLNNIIIGSEYRREIEPPLGFGTFGGNNLNYRFYFSFPFLKSLPYVTFSLFGKEFNRDITENLNYDPDIVELPEISTYEYIYISNSKYLFKANIKSKVCGVIGISFDGSIFNRISQYRISGDFYDGIYEIPIDFEVDIVYGFIHITDFCNNVKKFQNHDYISNQLGLQLTIPFYNWEIVDLTSIKDVSFSFNNIDVSKQHVSNIIYFNYPNYDIKNAPFSLKLPNIEPMNQLGYKVQEFYGHWNSTLNKFQIEFVVPKNSRSGKFDYSLSLGINSIDSRSFPDNYQLTIKKTNYDGMGPIFSEISKIAFPTGSNGQVYTFGWNLTISDPINGFDHGDITVMGSLDNTIYKFKLTSGSFVDSGRFDGVYKVTLSSGNKNEGSYLIIVKLVEGFSCVTQEYIITKAVLYDTAGQKSLFERGITEYTQNHPTLNNPFYLLSSDATINRIQIECINSPNIDTSPPAVMVFSRSRPQMDVGSQDRTITLTLNSSDPESGINYFAQGPIAYLMAENFEIIPCIFIIDSFSTYTADYTCTIEVPLGFGSGFGKIFLSFHGLTNNQGIYRGYTIQSFNTGILTTFSISNVPILLKTGLAFSKGGDFYFSGKSLTGVSKVFLKYSDTNQTEEFTNFKKFGDSMIQLSNLRPTTSNFLVFVQDSQNQISNRLLVSPTLSYDYTPEAPLPTNPPQKCKGEPECGGPTHGYCDINTGCKCLSPWIGNDCSAKVIETIKPPINETQPSTTIIVVNNNNQNTTNNNNINKNVEFKSIISIHSIREIGYDGTKLDEYPLHNQNWFLNNDDGKNNYFANIITKNNTNTKLSVSLEWFNSSKTVTFAEQQIEMNANTMKYTIEITNFPFSNKLSHLQLVISALFSSNFTGDSCSSKEFGETSNGDNSNYLKIQIDDKSLYSRLIKRGIIDDNKIIGIENTLLDETMNPLVSSTELQSYIAINIPHFDDKAILDPDFSVLLESSSVNNKNENSKCSSSSHSSSLTKTQLAGIIIGSFVGLVIIVFSALLITSKLFKNKSNNLLRLHMKLKNISRK